MGIRRYLGTVVFLLFATCALAQDRSEAIPSSAFARLDGLTNAELSPDGKRLAYLYPIDERQHLVIHSFETEANTVIPPLDDVYFNWIQWANDEDILFSLSMSAERQIGIRIETEETRLIGLNLKTQKITPLIKPAQADKRTGSRVAREYYGEPQIQDEVIDWMMDDPDHILVSLDEDFDGRNEVRKVNVRTGNYSLYRKSIEGVQHWVVDQDGEVRIGYGIRVGERRVVFKDAAGEWLPMGKTDWFQNGWEPVWFSDDPEVVYVMGDGQFGTTEVRKLNTQTGEFVGTLYSSKDTDASGIVLHPFARTPVGISYLGHRKTIEYFDPEMKRLQAAIDKAVPDATNYIRSTSTDLQRLVVHSHNDREPGMLLIWDREAKSIEPFGWFNEELDPDMMAPVEPVSYESPDGTEIPAYLTRPLGENNGPRPAIVLPHGGPTARAEQKFWFLSQFLASRGYVVLQPNFRGSTGYGTDFQIAGQGQWGGLMQDDVDAGARWLTEQGIADGERVCIVGWSYGGYSAAMGAIKQPGLYACGAGINGIYNLPLLYTDASRYVGGTYWTRHIGLDGEGARTVSPAHLAEELEIPFLIVHAKDDHRVQINQAQSFHKRLEGEGKDVRYVEVDQGGHSMRSSKARQVILDELERFLATHLAK